MIETPKLKIQSTRKAKHLIMMSGLTSKRLAELANVTQEHMSSVITGKSFPSPILASKIVMIINDRLKAEYQIDDIFSDTSVKKHAASDSKGV